LARTRHEQAKFDAIESRFMLTVVHELRNPAGVIKNYLQLLRGGYVDEAEWDEYLAKLEDRAGQLIEMLDDLLELAHLKARQTETGRLEPVDAADVLKKVAARFRPRAEAAGLEFRIDIAGRPTLPARPAHLESLWAHLIDNAVRYTNQGRVIVSLDQIPGQLITCVADTGIGMSTESLTRIFEEFYRGEQARETVEVGTGLGLPIVHQIVRLYDGSVEVDTAPGEGSRFTVSLPLHE
jgi:signal transduction histidine kinase